MSLNVANIYSRPCLYAGNNYQKKNLRTVGFSGQELVTPEVMQKLPLIAAEIQKADKIAVFTHGGPDGDAAGSSAAMKNLISSKYPDKKVDVFIMDAIPQGFKCLKDSESFEYINKKSDTEAIKARNYDLAIAVDTAEPAMMRDASKIFDSAKRKIKIDHHPAGSAYADVNLICGDASSASQLVLLLADHMGVKLNKDLASDIYLGLVTDTQGFRFMTKPADVLEDASKLAKSGFDTRNIYCSAIDYMPKAALKFYADVLKNIKFSEDGKVAYVIDDSIAEKDVKTGRYINKSKTFDKTGLEKADISDIFRKITGIIMPNIEGVKIAAKINEQEDRTKGCMNTGVSLRGNGVNVQGFAEKYNGGGHEFAAAFIGANEKAVDLVKDISEYLKSKEQEN